MTTQYNLRTVCECGAELAGDSEAELLNAAQEHIVTAHPHLLLGRGARARGAAGGDGLVGGAADSA